MFQTTKKAANYFIALQYPEKSYELDDGYQSQDKSSSPIHPMIAEEKPPENNNEPIYHKIGMRDASTVIQYDHQFKSKIYLAYFLYNFNNCLARCSSRICFW